MSIKAAVITFPGSNCDRDMYTTIANITGKEAEIVWHRESSLANDLDFIALPGGFTYGDYLRCGAMASCSPIMQEVKRHADRGTKILGVCNGFQMLTETKLVPGTLMRNAQIRFACKTTPLNIANTDSAFTSQYNADESIDIPIAHHDGNFYITEDEYKTLQDNNQIAFTYAENPNGSSYAIAGVLNKNKNILGMMPHPERACDAKTGGLDGRALFQSILEAC